MHNESQLEMSTDLFTATNTHTHKIRVNNIDFIEGKRVKNSKIDAKLLFLLIFSRTEKIFANHLLTPFMSYNVMAICIIKKKNRLIFQCA